MARIADQNGATGPLGELITALQRLPGIGARSAQRLAYHLLKTPREEVDALCAALERRPRLSAWRCRCS